SGAEGRHAVEPGEYDTCAAARCAVLGGALGRTHATLQRLGRAVSLAPAVARDAGALRAWRWRMSELTRRKVKALALIAPLALLLVLGLLAPIAVMLARSVQERELPAVMPQSAAALRAWHGVGVPNAGVLAMFVDELAAAKRTGRLSAVGNRLNYDIPGMRTL